MAILFVAAALASTVCSPVSASTVVRFDTVVGNIDVRLFDSATPESVENFLNYVNDGDYVDSFIHRAPTNFVLQGGGFTFVEEEGVQAVPTDPPVINEPGLTNLRGTLAYAKLGGDPNSATSGWFFNIGDNSANLDFQNGGFTVFGSVIGNGLEVIDELASLQIVNAGGAFTDLPVLDSFEPPTINREDLVLINEVAVLEFDAGDYNLDGTVGAADFDLLSSQFGNSLLIADQGSNPGIVVDSDGNGDGTVSIADFTSFRDNVTSSVGAVAPPVVAAIAVPEPATLAGMASCLAIAALRRRR